MFLMLFSVLFRKSRVEDKKGKRFGSEKLITSSVLRTILKAKVSFSCPNLYNFQT